MKKTLCAAALAAALGWGAAAQADDGVIRIGSVSYTHLTLPTSDLV